MRLLTLIRFEFGILIKILVDSFTFKELWISYPISG